MTGEGRPGGRENGVGVATDAGRRRTAATVVVVAAIVLGASVPVLAAPAPTPRRAAIADPSRDVRQWTPVRDWEQVPSAAAEDVLAVTVDGGTAADGEARFTAQLRDLPSRLRNKTDAWHGAWGTTWSLFLPGDDDWDYAVTVTAVNDTLSNDRLDAVELLRPGAGGTAVAASCSGLTGGYSVSTDRAAATLPHACVPALAGERVRFSVQGWTTDASVGDYFAQDQAPDAGLAGPVRFAWEPPPLPALRDLSAACPADAVPPSGFSDVTSPTHVRAIDCLAWWEITRGSGQGTFRPGDAVSRAQMAAFVARLVAEAGGDLPEAPADAFTDDDGVHEAAIDRLAAVGILDGVGGGRFAPDARVTRAQMAKFLAASVAFVTTQEPPEQGNDWFHDDDDVALEAMIERIADAGIAAGDGTGRYLPHHPVTRAQMASFVMRTADLLVAAGHAAPPV